MYERIAQVWHDEPVMLLGVVQMICALAVSFGMHLTNEQITMIVTLAGSILALAFGVRGKVAPMSNPAVAAAVAQTKVVDAQQKVVEAKQEVVAAAKEAVVATVANIVAEKK